MALKLLLEDGGYLLLEDGGILELEESSLFESGSLSIEVSQDITRVTVTNRSE